MNDALKQSKRVMLVVGEASGDLHGARLVKSLRQRDPSIEIFGVAGECLKKEGVRVIFDVARLTGMGFAELIGSLKTLWQAYRLLQRVLKEQKPNLLIFIPFFGSVSRSDISRMRSSLPLTSIPPPFFFISSAISAKVAM